MASYLQANSTTATFQRQTFPRDPRVQKQLEHMWNKAARFERDATACQAVTAHFPGRDSVSTIPRRQFLESVSDE